MRHYGFAGGSSGQDYGSVELGERHCVIRKKSGSRPIVANVLETERDPATGRITNVVLDCLVHDAADHRLGDYEPWGVFVTELRPRVKSKYET